MMQTAAAEKAAGHRQQAAAGQKQSLRSFGKALWSAQPSQISIDCSSQQLLSTRVCSAVVSGRFFPEFFRKSAGPVVCCSVPVLQINRFSGYA
jgi:hypothetical protein